MTSKKSRTFVLPRIRLADQTPPKRLKDQILRLPSASLRVAQDFACGLPLRSRPQCRLKCNEALSRDLWPLDPFESAPMRATSSGMSCCILRAIRLRLEIKELAESLSGKMGRNSLTPEKIALWNFPRKRLNPNLLSPRTKLFLRGCNRLRTLLKPLIQNLCLRPFQPRTWHGRQEMPRLPSSAT